MALPWLAGAAVAATVGYLASSSSSSSSSSYDDDDYYDKKEEAERREKEQKKQAFKRAKNDFKIKWGVKYKEDFETTENYTDIKSKITTIEDEINMFKKFSLEINLGV